MPPRATQENSLDSRVLKQISETLSDLSKDIRETRERVIRLEERDQRVSRLEQHILLLDERVLALMKDKDRRDGAVTAGQFIAKHLPIAGIAALAAAASAFIAKLNLRL